MVSERILNNYYNKGGYNKPQYIGYMMKMIREIKPLTEEEWKIWYLENVHDENYINALANQMYCSIPACYNATETECVAYIYDVMFRRTFQGYNKEKHALRILREVISQNVQEAPEIWDTEYFIDFFVTGRTGNLVGIQLKPETFYRGHYQFVVDIEGKMKRFCQEQNATAYVLIYKASSDDEITFVDTTVIEDIKRQL